MPQFIAKFYNLDYDPSKPTRSEGVLSTSDIIRFIRSVAEERQGGGWRSLEPVHIEGSLKHMGRDDWLKVAIHFNHSSTTLDDAMKRFIIITQRHLDPNILPGKEYNLVRISGTHFSHHYLYCLWATLVATPPLVGLQLVNSCLWCCCLEFPTWQIPYILTKQYTAKYSGHSDSGESKV
jgi:hypothetical protein